MKTLRQLQTVIFLTLGILFFFSCKKEQTTKIESISSADLKLERQIKTFQKKIQSNLKDSEVMEVDSIRWYLESSSNYAFGNASAENESIAMDSLFITIPISENFAALVDVESVYNTIVYDVSAFFYGLPYTEKAILCIAVEEVSQTDDSLQLKVTTIAVHGPIVGEWLFEQGQSWMYGDGLGNCNGNYLGQDAATEIERRIMLRRPVPVGNYYYTDITSVFIDARFFGKGIGPTNVGYSWMFLENSTWPNFHACLPYDECNLYLLGTEHVIYTDDENGGAKPTTGNFSLISIDLDGSVALNTTFYVHYGFVYYGIAHQTGQEE